MTQMVLHAGHNVWSALKKTLEGMMVGYMIGRQTSANRHVAQQLINVGEYKQDEYYNLVASLNTKTIASIRSEFDS
jgi:hypothetical protein